MAMYPSQMVSGLNRSMNSGLQRMQQRERDYQRASAAMMQNQQLGDLNSSMRRDAMNDLHSQNMAAYESMGRPSGYQQGLRQLADAAVQGPIGPRRGDLSNFGQQLVRTRGMADWSPIPQQAEEWARRPTPNPYDPSRLEMTPDYSGVVPAGARSYLEGALIRGQRGVPMTVVRTENGGLGLRRFLERGESPPQFVNGVGYVDGQLVRDPSMGRLDSQVALNNMSRRQARVLAMGQRYGIKPNVTDATLQADQPFWDDYRTGQAGVNQQRQSAIRRMMELQQMEMDAHKAALQKMTPIQQLQYLQMLKNGQTPRDRTLGEAFQGRPRYVPQDQANAREASNPMSAWDAAWYAAEPFTSAVPGVAPAMRGIGRLLGFK